MLLEPLIGTITEAVFGYALEQSGLGDRLRHWLGRDPTRLAFQTALLHALERFADRHPAWAASLLDETFFTGETVSRELARFLTRDTPDVNAIATTWAAQLHDVDEDQQEKAVRALADFLRFFNEELRKEEALQPLFDSRALERIAENTEALLATLRADYITALRTAERSVRIAGDVHHAVLVTGDQNTVNYFAEPARTLPTDYAGRVENFLHEYLGTPDRPVPFGGRTAELADLSRWLEDETARPYLLITAPAGRGKSALLTRWAAALQQRPDVAVAFAPISIRFNTNLYGVTFAILATQLAQIYNKPAPQKDETPEMWRAFVTEILRQPPPDGKRLVLVVDGLDEAADWTPGADLFPTQPAERVRVVVSARLTATRHTPDKWLDTLNWRDRAQARTLEGLDQKGIAEALASMGFPLDELGRNVDIVEELARLTEGDPLLVRLYVDDLWKRGEDAARLQPEDLQTLEPGYKGYFDRWWEDQRKLWGEQAPLKERDVREVLTLLACALGPLTQDDLLALADKSADLDPWTLGEALRPIARFVVGDRKQGYTLSHPKLGEYFREEVLHQEAKQVQHRFAAWAQETLATLVKGETPAEAVSPYLLHYASVHFQQIGDLESLSQLIETPAWYRASRTYDPSRHLFAADVERALTMAEERVPTGAVDTLPQVVAWSLLYATVRTLATNVPLEALEAMVLLGEHERALRYAALITDPEQQADAYRRMALTLLTHDVPNATARARQILQNALAAAEKIERYRDRAHALATIAQAFVQLGDTNHALAVAEKIEDDDKRAHALANIAQVLAQAGDTNHALAVAEKIERYRYRAHALANIAHAFAQLGATNHARQTLQIALAVAEKIEDDYTRAHALANIAQVLAQAGDINDALAVAEKIEDDYTRAHALANIAQVLAQAGDTNHALAAAEKIEFDFFRAHALANIAQVLAQAGDTNHALAVAEKIEDDYTRAHALTNIAQVLAQAGDTNHALAVAEKIERYRDRAQALANIAQAFVQLGDTNHARQTIQIALAVAEKIEDDDTRA
ncbi:ATP-binding protein, partial [Ardenticatena maritima]|uniref:ATP-binding protein n=1 Tax=Ardenticatena maritima TaxID=872965 RepID=UPI00128F1DA1